MLARLRHLSAPKLGAAGLALGVGGPKRLGLTVLVAATIAASTWSGEVMVAAATGYVVVATVLVWVPVVLSLLLGPANGRLTCKRSRRGSPRIDSR